jgi:hypothetical protein
MESQRNGSWKKLAASCRRMIHHAECYSARDMLTGKIGPGTMWNKEPVKNGHSGRDIT